MTYHELVKKLADVWIKAADGRTTEEAFEQAADKIISSWLHEKARELAEEMDKVRMGYQCVNPEDVLGLSKDKEPAPMNEREKALWHGWCEHVSKSGDMPFTFPADDSLGGWLKVPDYWKHCPVCGAAKPRPEETRKALALWEVLRDQRAFWVDHKNINRLLGPDHVGPYNIDHLIFKKMANAALDAVLEVVESIPEQAFHHIHKPELLERLESLRGRE